MSTKKTFRSQFNKVLEVDTYKDGSLSIGLGENEEPPFLARYHFDPAIAPALALAILEAAQGDNDACDANVHEAIVALLTYVMTRETVAEEAAALEKLTKRRNEVMNELRGDSTGSYDRCTTQFQRAIDRIIELEDKAQS